MTKKIKVQKKNIVKKPDEFVSSSQKVSSFLLENKKKIMTLTITVFVVILFLFGWRFYSQKTNKEAYLIYHQAVQYYHGNDTETFTKEESERYNQAITRLEKVINGYSHTNVLPLALLYAGHVYYKLKRFDESIDSYLSFLEKESSYNSLKIFAFAGLGYSYEAKGDYENALVYFMKLIDRDENPFAQLGYFDVSRCYDSLGEKDKAIEIYQTVLTNYPNSVFATSARKKMNILK